MKTYLFTCFLFIMSSAGAQSVNSESEIKAAINKLFEAMHTNDSAMLVGCFSENAVLQTIQEKKDGKVIVKTESITEFGSSVQKAFKGALDERAEFEMIKIDGPLASVWTPYKFYYQGKFLHCGVNSFQMVKRDGTWKIQYLTDTRRKEGCN